MPAAHALTTKERVKARIEMTGTGLDTVIDRMIAASTDYIENATGRRFKRTTYANEIYDGADIGPNPSGKPFLLLRHAPVASVTSIQYRQGTVSSPTWTSFTADDYILDPVSGIVQVSLPEGFQNVRVSYVAGYLINFDDEYDLTEHTLPFDISNLCERMVVKAIKKRDSEGRSQETFKDSTITWSGLLDAEDKDILANYRRVLIA